MKKICLGLFAITSLIANAGVFSNTGVAVEASTLGVGVDLSKAIYKDYLAVRLNGNFLQLDNLTYSQFKVDSGFASGGLLLDYQPFANNFRLTTGVYYINNNMNGSLSGQQLTLNGTTYSADDYTDARLNLGLNGFAPYLGMGYGAGAVTSKSRKGFYFKADAGVLYISPQSTLTGGCTSALSDANCQQFYSNLNAQGDIYENQFKDYLMFYPVVNLGVGYRF